MNHKGHFMLTHAITADPGREFAAEVRAGITKAGQKELPSKYLYDDVGSALFEVISVLPQYGLTRADERLLRRHAHEIVEQVPGPVAVAELGSGSGKKTRWLLKALCRRQHVSYFPIEISPTALAMCERELGGDAKFLNGLIRVIRRVERFSRPRLTFLFGHRLSNFVFGLVVAAGSIAAFVAPPFTGLDTLPALGVVLISLGVLLEDFYVVIAGLVVLAVGVFLEILLGSAAVKGIGSLF